MSYIELDDIHVKSVSLHQGDGNLLEFNASVRADIILKGIGKCDYETLIHNRYGFSLLLLGIC